MKKIFALLFILVLIYSIISIYFLDKVYFLSPIEYKNNFIIRSDARGDGWFAASRNGSRLHHGIDLLAQIGAPVLAARSGKVVGATRNNGMGNYIVIRHPQNFTTIYGHLSKVYVAKNQFVRQGEVIGRVGKTGNADFSDIQAHLHFEIRKKGIPQEPLQYLE